MSTQFEVYNEITFERFCKTSIQRAIRKGRQEKGRRAERERPLSELTDADLYKLHHVDTTAEEALGERIIVQTRRVKAVVSDSALGQALMMLAPQKREILILSYFLDLNDAEIGRKLGMSKSTVQWRRTAALEQLKANLMRL